MKRQPADPFKGAGHFVPRRPRKVATTTPKSRKAKPFLARTEAVAMFKEIQTSVDAALSRLHVIDLKAVRNDFEWIRQLAEDGRKAG